MLDGEAEAITRVAIDLAKAGDVTALRLCLERLIPPTRERSIRVVLPKVSTASDIPAALGGVLEAVAAGDLLPIEGQSVAGLLDAYRKAIETAELEKRIAELERIETK